MKKKISAGNKAKNRSVGNYDLSKKRKKNPKDSKQDFEDVEIEVLEINLSEFGIDFTALLDMQELDIEELNIEVTELDLDFSEILDFKLVEMSDLDWKDLLEKLNFDIELPIFDIFIEE